MAYLYYFSFMIITSCIIWFQTVAPIKFPIFLHKYTFFVYLLGLITSILFVEASKIGATIFQSAWTIRFIGFGINTLIFAFLTQITIGENFSPKTIICLCLSIIILLIQCIWK